MHTEQPLFIRPKEAAKLLGISRTMLHEMAEHDPAFPRKTRLSSRCVGWTRQQLTTWLDLKSAQ